MDISVVIPTYNRPELLKECLMSCLSQTLSPKEIIIGDDSTDDETRKVVESVAKNNRTEIEIIYFKHNPQKRQIENVNFLIEKSQMNYVTLIHDDDYLLPNCLYDLSRPIIDNPKIDASFGKQYIVDMEGEIDISKSEELNISYYRTSNYSGEKLTPYQSGILQQFPNNAYLIRATVFKKYKYSTNEKRVGDACDFFFSFNLGLKNLKFYFIDKYTAAYRVGNEKISNLDMNDASLKTYFIIKNSRIPEGESEYYHKKLAEEAPKALLQAINRKEVKEALSIFYSKYHFQHLFSLGGIKRSFLLLKLLFINK